MNHYFSNVSCDVSVSLMLALGLRASFLETLVLCRDARI
jgi:hypothetical protein